MRGRARRAILNTLLAGALLAHAGGRAPAQEAAGAAQGQPDAALPALGAPEGAITTARLDRPLDRYALPVAPFGGGIEPLRQVQGRVTWSAYRLADPQASATGVMQTYRDRLAGLGFTPLLDCANQACGGFDFRFGVELLPAPAMLIDTADFVQLSATRPEPDGGETLASVLVSRVLEAVQVQIVLVRPAGTAQALTETPAPPAASAPPAMMAQDEAALLARLTGQGHVAVQGLEFEIGGAALSPSSAPALETTARLLQSHPELKILIVGHSDNEGALDANMALSKRRAEAVRTALVALGVAADRLDAQGAGFLAPVAPNATPEGRAQNRRVELVLR